MPLRERLTEREIGSLPASLVRFTVGLDAYEQEGGGIRRDLFAEDDMTYCLTDAALLELAGTGQAGGHRRRGEEPRAGLGPMPRRARHADLHAFQRAPRSSADPTSAKRSVRQLQAKDAGEL